RTKLQRRLRRVRTNPHQIEAKMNQLTSSFHSVEKPTKQEIVALPMAGDSTQDTLLETASVHLYPNYAQPPLVIDRGQGAQLWDKSGKRYVDFYAGIAVSSLGHNHPALVGAISRQAEK